MNLDFHQQLKSWTSHVDQCDFINCINIDSEQKKITDDNRYTAFSKKRINNAYQKILKFIDENGKNFNEYDIFSLKELADRIESVGSFTRVENKDLIEKINKIAKVVRAREEKTLIEVFFQIPDAIQETIQDYLGPLHATLKKIAIKGISQNSLDAVAKLAFHIGDLVDYGDFGEAAEVTQIFCRKIQSVSESEEVLKQFSYSLSRYAKNSRTQEIYDAILLLLKIIIEKAPPKSRNDYFNFLNSFFSTSSPNTKAERKLHIAIVRLRTKLPKNIP